MSSIADLSVLSWVTLTVEVVPNPTELLYPSNESGSNDRYDFINSHPFSVPRLQYWGSESDHHRTDSYYPFDHQALVVGAKVFPLNTKFCPQIPWSKNTNQLCGIDVCSTTQRTLEINNRPMLVSLVLFRLRTMCSWSLKLSIVVCPIPALGVIWVAMPTFPSSYYILAPVTILLWRQYQLVYDGIAITTSFGIVLYQVLLLHQRLNLHQTRLP